MSTHKNVIELNGKLYDSTSGAIVGSPSKGTSHPVVIKPKHSGTVLDGFVKKPGAVKRPPSVNQQKPVAAKHPRPTPKSVAAHSRHRAKTLARKGLKKPALASPNHVHEPVHTKDQIDNSPRLSRAKLVPKSAKISRFGLVSHHSFTKKTEPLHVAPAPRKPHHGARPSIDHHTEPPIPTNNQILKEQLVSKAIEDGRSTELPHKKTKKHRVSKKLGVSPKVVHFGVGTFAALLLIGFIAYQNATNISMRIAASRAGFNASIPTYQPAGFGLNGPIEYGPGQITLNFKSNSDQRNFHITQRVSNWNSDTLLSNFVTSNNKSYQTYQEKGRTIYIYDGSSATWVSGGVWYQIEGNSSLSSDQLIRLASSI